MSAGVCRVCGCTDARACDGGCWWVQSDLCSSCWARQREALRARAANRHAKRKAAATRRRRRLGAPI